MKAISLLKKSDLSDYLKKDEKHTYNISFEGLTNEFITIILT